jgi:hypothetical protein
MKLRGLAAALGVVLLNAAAAAAQTPSPPPTPSAPSTGPMTIERLHSGFLGGPDVKITDVDGHASVLVGGQGGWIADDTIFVGGAGYWLTNGTHDREMAYGGLVVQWLAHGDRRLGYGLRGLVGGGEATLSSTIAVPIYGHVRPNRVPIDFRQTTVRYYQGFFVAEPEGNLFVKINDHLRLVGGVGYRFVGAEHHDDSRLSGVTGSIGVQIF